jgi:hypothetical protein
MGTQADWRQLLLKLDQLSGFGSQPAEYSTNLRPILSRFVKSFDDPDGPDIRRFWDSIIAGGGGSDGKECSGGSVVDGWINGFHYWDASGRLLSRPPGLKGFALDGVVYPSRSINDMPYTYSHTPLRARINVSGYIYIPLGNLTAGMVGKKITNGAPESYATAMQRAHLSLPSSVTKDHHSMLEPFSRWLLITEPCAAVLGESKLAQFSRCNGPGD